MKMMTRYILGLFFALGVFGIPSGSHAQQTATSLNHLFRPRLWNPASRGGSEFNKLVISHQQRHLAVPGWKSTSQFLDFNSAPLGKRGLFGWGLMVNNDIEHTENRFTIDGATAVSVVRNKTMRLNVGIDLGLINWSSNYDSVRVFDRTDPILDRPSNIVELDAGLGLDFEFTNKFWDIQIGAAAMQLPRNMASGGGGERIFPVYPHLLIGGLAMMEPIHNLKIGPSAFYKNIFMEDSVITKGGNLDVGLKLELDRQGMWFGGAYRLGRSALSAAFGMQVFLSDSANHPHHNVLIVDMNAGFSYPIQTAAGFGPTAEVGLSIYFGRELKYRQDDDTTYYVKGSFWIDDGYVSRHLQSKVLANAPNGTRGTTFVTNKNVTLTYDFPDPNLQYIGTTPDINGDTLFSLGVEWVGVDGFLEGMVWEVIDEALDPDTLRIKNPEVLEPLEGLVFLEFSSLLKANETEAFFDADGMVYEGELGTNNKTEDSLIVPVVYNRSDTIIGIPLNRYISNLELAVLKIYAMRKKLIHELETKYGKEMAFIIEGEKIDAEQIVGKKLVTIRKPFILPNHPHQDVFQINQLKIKFTRDSGTVLVSKSGEPTDEAEELILKEDQKKKRQSALRFRDKR